jgi:cell division septum initiation protein DivIVA
MDILYLLDRLEEAITSGTRVPFSNRSVIDEQECLDILDQIRIAIPQEIKEARRVYAERDQILNEATEQANRLLQEADEEARSRTSEHAIVRAAEARAVEIEERAYRLAEQTRREADKYAYEVLLQLQRRLDRVAAEVQLGLEELRASIGEAAARQPTEAD